MKVHRTWYRIQKWQNDAWEDVGVEFQDVKDGEESLLNFAERYPTKKHRLVQYVNYLRVLKEKL